MTSAYGLLATPEKFFSADPLHNASCYFVKPQEEPLARKQNPLGEFLVEQGAFSIWMPWYASGLCPHLYHFLSWGDNSFDTPPP